MASNDVIILDTIIQDKRTLTAPELHEDSFFEHFSAEQILKDFDLSYDELETGLVDGTRDGGIDGFFTFANGDLVQDDTDLDELPRTVAIDLYIIQSKNQTSFKESAVQLLDDSLEQILDLNADLSNYKARYNENVIRQADIFRNLFKQLSPKFPKVTITVTYTSKGDEVHPNVQSRAEDLKRHVETILPGANVNFQFLGARSLIDLAREQPKHTFDLKMAENPISSSLDIGYICLVKIADYFTFITDEETGQLNKKIFDANVRDYQGDVQVNQEIQKTLKHDTSKDFWWFNNGITIVSSKATQTGKTLTIENPSIVNGLQTSHEIFKHGFDIKDDSQQTLDDNRTLLVRVIVPPADDVRDKIIKANNSQTKIPIASLRATEKLHRDIEEFFKQYNLYYDRRKNFYKNQGKPRKQIISIPLLAQSIMAIALQQPNSARARPSSLLKKQESYDRVFNESYPIEIYLACVTILRKSQEYLRDNQKELDQKTRNNIQFYLGMTVAQILCRRQRPSIRVVANIKEKNITPTILDTAFNRVWNVFNELGATDQIAKGNSLIMRLLEQDLPETTPNQ